MRRIELDGWVFAVPDELSGGTVRHHHAHIDSMAIYREEQASNIEVIVTTYPGQAISEKGALLDATGTPWRVRGATKAVRRDDVTQLDDDPEVDPVNTIMIVATSARGSACLVVHRPLESPPDPSEAVARSLERTTDMRRRLPFPFPHGRFPADLGAVVQRTVLEGDEPARTLVHSAEGDWLVGDGVNDPNEPGASVATHIWHAIERNSSIAELADLPPGNWAHRTGPGEPWTVETHGWEEDG